MVLDWIMIDIYIYTQSIILIIIHPLKDGLGI